MQERRPFTYADWESLPDWDLDLGGTPGQDFQWQNKMIAGRTEGGAEWTAWLPRPETALAQAPPENRPTVFTLKRNGQIQAKVVWGDLLAVMWDRAFPEFLRTQDQKTTPRISPEPQAEVLAPPISWLPTYWPR